MTKKTLRRQEIYDWIAERTIQNGKVLDIGCGDGELLAQLVQERQVHGTGIEIDEDCVVRAVQRGLSVHHGNVEEGLDHYADKSFDLVIMSLTIQEIKDPLHVLQETARVGKKAIVVFPNFAHWRSRWQLALAGRAPVSGTLPHKWYNSPNLHFCSVLDWEEFCRENDWKCLDRGFLAAGHPIRWLPNLRAEVAMYFMEKQ
ncbi:MAG: methionine biosynthesis protein MetW [Sedimentisphaerales bacterium]|nr:methionine biosynthesis protein MetW [Sedimentisphaerales bacterium]